MSNEEDVPESKPMRPFKENDEEDENESCQILVNNSNNILRVFKQLFEEKEMCDVILKVGNKEYGAHRLVLCASSDVFKVMLMKPEWNEWHENKIELQEMNLCENVFYQFLEYFYTGKILITHTNVMPILALADKYLVNSLSRICESYMCRHVPHAASHNQLFLWHQYSSACCHDNVFEICENYIKWNLESVANTPDYSNFDIDMFIKIIEQDDIVVRNEIVLYNCVARWLQLQKIKLYQTCSSNSEIDSIFKMMIEKIMRYIRFPMMTPREMADLLLSPLIKEHKEFFVDRMTIGMKYHSGFTDQIQSYLNSEERFLFTPRLYTSDSCSAVLTIENFHSIPSYNPSTFLFSSHLSAAEHEMHKVNEWVVDLYPKGVWFKKCYLIVWQGTLEVPQEVLSTVRLSLTCSKPSETEMRVKVSVLIYGILGGVEHIMEVKERVHHFSLNDRVMNMDDLIPFHELNRPATQPKHQTSYLVGPNRDELKLSIVIAPIR